jgi:lipid-A-disaccharide synthase
MRLGMVAGEASGDVLAALLLGGLRQAWPQLQAAGIGGPRMQAQGFEAWWPHERLSVFGYVDALKRLPELLRIRALVGERLLKWRPDLFVGVDAPDFNFSLERRLREQGVKTVHFVCPSLWAWRPQRAQTLKACADHVLCLFPFEPAVLAASGVAATFVGHPLADHIPLEPPRAQARQALGLGARAAVVALLPGSRRSELLYLAEPMIRAACLMRQASPDLHFVVPLAPGMRPLWQQALARAGASPDGFHACEGQSHTALAACDVAMVASGTATLEAALFKRPMVIAYRMHALNWWRIRSRRLQPWVGLPNILAQRFVVPELLQQDCTPEALARETLAWLDDPARCEAAQAIFEAQHLTLRRNTSEVALEAISTLLAR